MEVWKVRQHIVALPLSLNQEIHNTMEEYVGKLDDHHTLTSIFHFLNSNVWNFIDYYLLEYLITEFGSDNLKEDMKKYISELERFQQHTTVYHFAQCWIPKKKPEIYANVREKTGMDPRKCTLEVLNKKRKELCEQFLPPFSEYAIFLYNIEIGCFQITWTMPPQLADALREKITSNRQKSQLYFQEHSILSFTIHQNKQVFIYQG